MHRRVCEAMRYSLFAGGKRLRPMLALAAAEAVAMRHGHAPDAARALALPAACAIELIHTYSLVHDDLPAMDDDTLRRGRPTSHVVFGEGMAILAGDALLTEAFALLAREPGVGDCGCGGAGGRKLHAIAVVADAAGRCGHGRRAGDRSAGGHAWRGTARCDGLRAMHARKTGALIRGVGDRRRIDGRRADTGALRSRRYATALGLAFQIVDDILDVEGASASLGKTAGKDAAAGKPTYPALYGLEESRRLAAECVDRARAALDARGSRTDNCRPSPTGSSRATVEED